MQEQLPSATCCCQSRGEEQETWKKHPVALKASGQTWQGVQAGQVSVRGAFSSPGGPGLPPLTGEWEHTPRNGNFEF